MPLCPHFSLWLCVWEHLTCSALGMCACACVHASAKSDTKASVSSHVHCTHTLAAEGGGGSLWHTLLEAYPGGDHETHTCTDMHTQIPITPLPVLLWWWEGGIAAWGAPLESGTDGRTRRRVIGPDSQLFCTLIIFFYLCWLHGRICMCLTHI